MLRLRGSPACQQEGNRSCHQEGKPRGIQGCFSCGELSPCRDHQDRIAARGRGGLARAQRRSRAGESRPEGEAGGAGWGGAPSVLAPLGSASLPSSSSSSSGSCLIAMSSAGSRFTRPQPAAPRGAPVGKPDHGCGLRGSRLTRAAISAGAEAGRACGEPRGAPLCRHEGAPRALAGGRRDCSPGRARPAPSPRGPGPAGAGGEGRSERRRWTRGADPRADAWT